MRRRVDCRTPYCRREYSQGVTNIVIGILAIVIGAAFCFWGVVAMRFVIAAWGALVGLNLGGWLIAATTGEQYLSTALGWIVGIAVAILVALVAYFFYAAAIVIAMASVGFAVGSTVAAAAGVTWNWVIVLIGAVLGVLLAFAALAVDLPAILLVVVSALGGATAIVGGIMLATSTLHTGDFDNGTVRFTIDTDWWWYALYLVLVIAGIVAQSRLLTSDPRLQEQWSSRN